MASNISKTCAQGGSMASNISKTCAQGGSMASNISKTCAQGGSMASNISKTCAQGGSMASNISKTCAQGGSMASNIFLAELKLSYFGNSLFPCSEVSYSCIRTYVRTYVPGGNTNHCCRHSTYPIPRCTRSPIAPPHVQRQLQACLICWVQQPLPAL